MTAFNLKWMVSIMAGIVFLGGVHSAEKVAGQESATGKTAQTECPVMGGKINRDLFVDYRGKRIYVCCSGCIEKLRNEPEKYIKKLEAKGVVLERTSQNAPAAEQKNESSKKNP